MTGIVQDKVAIITGAAQGLGRAAAELYAEQGAQLVLVDLSPEIDAVARQLGGAPRQVHGIVRDLTDEAAAEYVVSVAEKEYGRVDILVNNAGITQVNPITKTSLAEWNRTVLVNLTTQFLMMRSAIPAMQRAGAGAIVNVGSMSSMVGLADQGAYAPAKSGVLMLTRQGAVDYGKDRIRVNCVCPGPMMTPMVRANADAYPDPQAWLDSLAERTPLGRISEPKEVAQVLLFLGSDLASYVTGAIIPVDGGWTAQ